jgi:aspartyl-tRNA(Asn)/glutamyl-tRNA(Gln) amidotransferase subunit A
MTPSDHSTLTGAASALDRGDLTSVDLLDESLAAIARHHARTNAFVTVDEASARRDAEASDTERARGFRRGPLHGLPLSIKDLIDQAGVVTTAGSRLLADRVAVADAPIVTRLRRAGAVIIGRTNLHEFALGPTSDDSAFGPVRHPLDSTRVAGGSSGGSAVAVATGMGLASVGTDTGGSVRIPAAACGVVGLKPAPDDIPTAGVIPLSHSLDHVGPLARTVQDAAWLWAVLAGRTPLDIAPARPNLLRLRRLRGYFDAPLAPEVREAIDTALGRLTEAGVRVDDGEFGRSGTIVETYASIVLPEAAHWHAAFLETRAADYTAPVRARLERGRAIAAVAYFAACEARASFRADIDALLSDCDALVLPTLPIVAPTVGAGDIQIDPAVPQTTSARAAMLRQTQLFNLTGHPAISLPVVSTGLPVGLQIVGPFGNTARLLAIAAACEKIVGRADADA